MLNTFQMTLKFITLFLSMIHYTVKPVLRGHSKRRPKIGFQDRLSLNAGQKYCRMLKQSILQYFRPSLSYHLSLRPLICLFLSGCLRQVLLYLVTYLTIGKNCSIVPFQNTETEVITCVTTNLNSACSVVFQTFVVV